MKMFTVAVAVLSVCCLANGGTITKRASTPRCVEGKFLKPFPSPESGTFYECHAWKDNSCCTASLTQELHLYKSERMYHGYRYDRCGPLSPLCDHFILQEECFFDCEPNTYKWIAPSNDTFIGLPICSSYCNDWFAACRHDKTCVVDWLDGFDYSGDGTNKCPKNSTCRTFEQVYGTAEGMCNKMWGPAFKYTTGTNCMLMNFNPVALGGNPNDHVTPN